MIFLLTQKEVNLLTDLKKCEEVCVQKYNKYAQSASSPSLKSLFQQISQKEQQHLNSIDQILNGSVPTMNANSSSSNNNSNTLQQPSSQAAYYDNTMNKQNDAYLCSDALTTEKYVSSDYNISIFEFTENNIRDVLNHIQKEEQEHGKAIYDYMAQNGMYN